MTQETVFESSLPLTVDQIAEGPWTGVAIGRNGAAIAYIHESPAYPGFYFCRVLGRAGCSETQRPVAAHAVGIQMDSLLSLHGYTCADFRWKRDVPAGARPSPVEEIVYFLRAGEFIKIGKTTGDPSSRVAQLQTGCPFPIEVLATMPGGRGREAKLHKKFAALRAHGEWFHASPVLMAFIDGLSQRAEGAL